MHLPKKLTSSDAELHTETLYWLGINNFMFLKLQEIVWSNCFLKTIFNHQTERIMNLKKNLLKN